LGGQKSRVALTRERVWPSLCNPVYLYGPPSRSPMHCAHPARHSIAADLVGLGGLLTRRQQPCPGWRAASRRCRCRYSYSERLVPPCNSSPRCTGRPETESVRSELGQRTLPHSFQGQGIGAPLTSSTTPKSETKEQQNPMAAARTRGQEEVDRNGSKSDMRL
jgi:hypothetical protein